MNGNGSGFQVVSEPAEVNADEADQELQAQTREERGFLILTSLIHKVSVMGERRDILSYCMNITSFSHSYSQDIVQESVV